MVYTQIKVNPTQVLGQMNHPVQHTIYLPDEGGGRQPRDAGEEQRDGPRLVEQLHRYPLHRPLVDLDKVLGLQLRVVLSLK